MKVDHQRLDPKDGMGNAAVFPDREPSFLSFSPPRSALPLPPHFLSLSLRSSQARALSRSLGRACSEVKVGVFPFPFQWPPSRSPRQSVERDAPSSSAAEKSFGI